MTKSIKNLTKLSKNSRYSIIAFLSLFAITGGYLVYQSFASGGRLTGTDQVILEYGVDSPATEVTNGLLPVENVNFRLYGDGKAICGNYPATDTNHTAQYYQSNLTNKQLNNLTYSIDQSGFTNLNPFGIDGKVSSENSQYITYNTTEWSKQVYAPNKGEKPDAYKQVISQINTICASAKTIYTSAEANVSVKKIEKLPAGATITGELPSDITATDTGLSSTSKDAKTVVQSTKNSLYSQVVNNRGQVFYKKGTDTIQVIGSPTLPKTNPKPIKPKDNLYSNSTRSTTLGASPAKAATPLKLAFFCSTDSACPSFDPSSYANQISKWYSQIVQKNVTIQSAGTIRGQFNTAWYNTCHLAGCYDSYDAVLYNTIFEVAARSDLNSQFNSNIPTQFILAFPVNGANQCGITSYSQRFGIIDYQNKACNAISTITHEFGHALGLHHIVKSGSYYTDGVYSGIMYTPSSSHCLTKTLSPCSLEEGQTNILRAFSPYFEPRATSNVTISGKVRLFGPTGPGLPGVKIDTCAGTILTTNSSGNYSWTVPTGKKFCLRIQSAPAGPITSNNYPVTYGLLTNNYNPSSYENMTANVGCMLQNTACPGNAALDDKSQDNGLDFWYPDTFKGATVQPTTSAVYRVSDNGIGIRTEPNTSDRGFYEGFGGGTYYWKEIDPYYRPEWGYYFPDSYKHPGRNFETRAIGINQYGRGYILWGDGTLKPLKSFNATATPTASGAPYWKNWDIARDFKIFTNSLLGYELDGYGGLHAINGAPATKGGAYFAGNDIARRFVLKNDNTGGYILDGFGGMHPFAVGSATIPAKVTGGPYWPGNDIARSVVLNPGGTGGYILDGYGGVHPFGVNSKTPPPAITGVPYTSGKDYAREIVITNWSTTVPTGYVLDAFGTLNKFGG